MPLPPDFGLPLLGGEQILHLPRGQISGRVGSLDLSETSSVETWNCAWCAQGWICNLLGYMPRAMMFEWSGASQASDGVLMQSIAADDISYFGRSLCWRDVTLFSGLLLTGSIAAPTTGKLRLSGVSWAAPSPTKLPLDGAAAQPEEEEDAVLVLSSDDEEEEEEEQEQEDEQEVSICNAYRFPQSVGMHFSVWLKSWTIRGLRRILSTLQSHQDCTAAEITAAPQASSSWSHEPVVRAVLPI